MSKNSKLYICSNCDAQFLKWNGRCTECGKWGTLKEEVVEDVVKKLVDVRAADIIDLSKIESKKILRIKTGISEADRVFGGGIVPGSLILLAGEPGAGKSTLVAQITNKIKNNNIIYISGEESAIQIKSRFNRLKCDLKKIKFISETNTDKIISRAKKENPELIIVDSIQTVYSPDSGSDPGGINQIRATTAKFLEYGKKNNVPIILIGHITKDGQVAGPKTLEHMVDTVIYLENNLNSNYSMMRVKKNRFGSINELGIFEMTGRGFIEVKNPSSAFMGNMTQKISGSVISCVMEGTRPFLLDIQALVSTTVFGYPQRKSSGLNLNRLQVLSSVITKRTKVNLTNQDIVLNIVGGFKVDDTALDLAVCVAIISSLLNQVIDRNTIILGEVGLGGEIRNISRLSERLKEAEKLGFKNAIIPDVEVKNCGMKIKKVKNISEYEI